MLRPGGHLIVSDSRGFLGSAPAPLVATGPDGLPGYMPNWNRLTSEYIETALPLGFQVRRCTEHRRPTPLMDPATPPATPGPVGVSERAPDVWELHTQAVAATNAAYRRQPAAIVWHFELVGR